MSDDEDDSAVTWAGDSDISHVAGPTAAPVIIETAPADAKPGIPSFLLVTYGVLAGVYLLYTIGWLVGLQRMTAGRVPSSDLLAEFMTQLGLVLAMAAPLLWFISSFLLTRDRKPIVRLLWILAGVILVLPWPFVLGAWL